MARVDVDELRKLVDADERSARKISLDAGLGATAIKDIFSGKSKDPGAGTMSAIADALGVRLATLMVNPTDSDVVAAYKRPAATPSSEKASSQPAAAVGSRRVPVLGTVQAGAWAEVIDTDPGAVEYIIFDEPEYARSEVFALIVRGPSTDRVYPDGSRVICIPAIEGGVREGDFVIVRRRRGIFAETTLKQIQIGEDGGIELWPRSNDPAFQEPIRLSATRDADDAPEILAVVIARYDVGRAGRGPLIQFSSY